MDFGAQKGCMTATGGQGIYSPGKVRITQEMVLGKTENYTSLGFAVTVVGLLVVQQPL